MAREVRIIRDDGLMRCLSMNLGRCARVDVSDFAAEGSNPAAEVRVCSPQFCGNDVLASGV